MTNLLQRTVIDNGGLSRAEQRKQRLIQAESELALEEAEALKLTAEQQETLLRPFAAVKAEFSDLDGLRWTQSALRRFQPSHWRSAQAVAPPTRPLSKNTFLVLSAEESFPSSPDDTIRATSPKFYSFMSTIQASQISHRRRDGTRSRSPIKGLFSSRSPSLATENSATVQFPVGEADITDASDDSGMDDDTAYKSRYYVGRSNSRLRLPPGLPPPHHPTTQILPPTTETHRASINFISAKEFSDISKPHLSFRSAKDASKSCTDVPFPHRDAPSPPSQQPCLVASTPSISFPAPAVASDTATLRASALRTFDPTATVAPAIKSKLNPTRPTGRTRLHSLLKDVRHGRISTSIPMSPRPQPSTTTSHPPPLELSATPESRDLTELGLFIEDDETTPHPSPTFEQCQTLTIPQLHNLSH